MPRPEPFPQKSTIDRFILASVRLAGGAASRLAPGVATRWAAHSFLTPRRFPRPAREAAWLAAGRRFEIEFEGRRLAAWEWGSGPAVALVHGWEGRAGQLGAFAVALAGAGFRAVAFDAPGHGDSPGASSSLPAFAAALAAVERTTGPLAAVVAHSAGAAATTFALHRGLGAERAVFLAPPSDFGAYARAFGALLGLTSEVEGRVRRLLEARVGVPWPELEPLAIAPGLEVPLRIVHDRDDPEIPWSGGRALAAAWPGAELVTTRGLGHRRILRDPAVVAGVVELLAAGRSAALEPERPAHRRLAVSAALG
jgi:pimeloyl-ACP methyl ester carboxylesterase